MQFPVMLFFSFQEVFREDEIKHKIFVKFMSIIQFVRRCAENTIMLVELEISRVPL